MDVMVADLTTDVMVATVVTVVIAVDTWATAVDANFCDLFHS